MLFEDYDEYRGPIVRYESGIAFIPKCPKCGRYVKPDTVVNLRWLDNELSNDPNATCSACGRVKMPVQEGSYVRTSQ